MSDGHFDDFHSFLYKPFFPHQLLCNLVIKDTNNCVCIEDIWKLLHSDFQSLKILHESLSFSLLVSNGGQPSSSQGSDSYSSTSSLSSGTPVSSLSGLSQVMFPPVFGSEMVDVCISTEDRSRRPSSERIETAMQTDPQELDTTSRSSRVITTETSRTVGETVLLKDTAIRSGTSNSRTRTFSAGDKETLESPKTAVLMALSKPRKPIRRSQSHITVSGIVNLF